MCGINGYFSLGTAVNTRAEQHLADMNRCIAHRGPDDHGTWSDPSGHLHLGHLRLSIIDLSPGGHQPMISQSGTVIIFNGEIFNYKELKERFFPGHTFRSGSDTEVILLLYEKFGSACLQHLNGMFAFAIWDPTKQELFIARDRSGKKPLYYTVQEGVFSFSSEIKALLELPWVKRELDEEALYHFLTYNMLPAPLTMFKDIRKLDAATFMIVKSEGIRSQEKFWDINYSDLSGKSQEECEDELYKRLLSAVDYRMVSDVPVGAFLSGGVDSSAIVTLMAKKATYPVKTYSVGFEGQPDYDELEFAGKIARNLKTDHYEQIISAHDIRDYLPHVVDVFDEPMADATCIPIHFISKKAREEGTIVVLTGDGSDELFAGYRNWQKYLKRYPMYRTLRKMPALLRKGMAAAYSVYAPGSAKAEIFHRAAQEQEFFWGGARSFKESTKRSFLSDAFNVRHPHLNSYSVIAALQSSYLKMQQGSSRSFSDVDWMCYLGYKFIIPNYYLYRMDRLGMSNSIEIRTPFLDYELVNYALSLPGFMKSYGGEPKYILKKSLERILPKEILYRKKMGFNVPLREWAGEMMLDFIDTHLDEFCDRHPAFNKDGLRKQVQRFKSGDEKVTNTLWTVYFLMAWFKKWLP